MQTIQTQVPDVIVDGLRELASEHDQSLDAYCRKILEEHARFGYRIHKRETLEAPAESGSIGEGIGCPISLDLRSRAPYNLNGYRRAWMI